MVSDGVLNASPEARILDYWIRRRIGLSDTEWTDFYRLVTSLLMNTRLGSEYADPDKRRDLINVFFTERIFLNAESTEAGPLENVHALHRYLKNFAISLQRKEAVSAQPEGGIENLSTENDDLGLDDASEGAWTNSSIEQQLAEAGMAPEEIGNSANAFLDTLDPGEIAYLRYHTCEDEEEREPISRIAQRLALGSSYHYKARILGVTRSKGETFAGYEKTKIGAWLVSLGAEFSSRWQEELAILLMILCHQALAREVR